MKSIEFNIPMDNQGVCDVDWDEAVEVGEIYDANDAYVNFKSTQTR